MTADSAEPTEWVLFLHGVLGRRANWKTIARRLVEVRPRLGAVLADLRLHGDSPERHPPHTMKAAAEDLRELDAVLPRGRIVGVLGHSLGGKVALHYASAAEDVRWTWTVDSQPGPLRDVEAQSAALSVVATLESLPAVFDERASFTGAIEAAGHGRKVGAWLAMNLEREGDGFRFALDLAAIRELLESFFEDDAWGLVEHPRPGLTTHLFVASRSTAYVPEDIARARASEARVTVVENAGHWLHVDAPDALLRAMLVDLDA